jgi:hypothetical protein
MPSQKSGGLRSGEKRRAEAAARAKKYERWNDADLRLFSRLPKHEESATGAYLEGLDVLRLVVRRASRNPALTPQSRHEMAGRHAAALVKAADPGRIIQQQGDELRAALALIESLKEKLRVARPAPRDSGSASAGDLC